MIFTELQFFIFFAVVISAVILNATFAKSVSIQNAILLLSSYYFYANWDWRFLSLIMISTVVDFIAGGRIVKSKKPIFWLLFSLCTNLGILGFFKYFNFFIEGAVSGLEALGIEANITSLNIILPVGISFYTFQTLTYTIDIYRKKLEPTSDLLSFATFVAFFPQLVAGPIERASRLLPQFSSLWSYDEDRILSGLRLILFGLFLKLVVADNLAPIVNAIFSSPESVNGGTLFLGSIYFAFQIYGDFCGYSTIAIGLGKLLGFELMTNFSTPYFSTSIQEFWRRWHISLSSFFRDYVYIPLGGSRKSKFGMYRNLLATFLLSGLWHGANWTFIAWGGYHGILLIIQNIASRILPSVGNNILLVLIRTGLTFFLVCIGWILFRSETISGSWTYIQLMVTDISVPSSHRIGVLFVLAGILVDFLWHKDTRLESALIIFHGKYNRTFSLIAYTGLFWLTVINLFHNNGNEFIYFQF